MKDRTVYFASKETGIVWLDPDGRVAQGDEGGVLRQKPRQEEPPPPPPIDLDALRREAFQQGVEAGKQEALLAVQQELLQIRQHMQHLLQNLPAQIQQGVADAEPQLLQLALAIAQKILQAEIRQNPEVIRRVLQAAMAQVKEQTIIAIHLHPTDLSTIQPQFAEGRVELMPDPNLQRGGCRVETDLGEIDATLETQWAAVEKALKEATE